MSPLWFQNSIAALTDGPPPRVWSVIVSLLGDMGQDPGARISGGALTRVMELMNIRSEAMRVALHRLRKDGWIESQRIGRVSYHGLSIFGRQQSAKVTPRIYARDTQLPARWPEEWQFVLLNPGDGTLADQMLVSDTALELGQGLWLSWGAEAPAETLVFSARGADIPAWVRDRLYPEDLHHSCEDLLRALTIVSGEISQPNPWQSAALRTLVVHHWRRLLLRHHDLPVALQPTGWPGDHCRDLVHDILDQLPAPDLAELDQI